jgi:hypothetical protein
MSQQIVKGYLTGGGILTIPPDRLNVQTITDAIDFNNFYTMGQYYIADGTLNTPDGGTGVYFLNVKSDVSMTAVWQSVLVVSTWSMYFRVGVPEIADSSIVGVSSWGTWGNISNVVNSALSSHVNNTSNPHNVTAAQLGLSAAIKIKGSVNSYANLPTNASEGDMYQVETADTAKGIDAGDCVVWNGSSWENFGGWVDCISAITESGGTITITKTDNTTTTIGQFAKTGSSNTFSGTNTFSGATTFSKTITGNISGSATTVQNIVSVARSTAYSLNQIAYISSIPSWGYLECTTAGTTASTAPTWPTTANSTVTDGTAVWTLRDIRQSQFDISGNKLLSYVKAISVSGNTLTLKDAAGNTIGTYTPSSSSIVSAGLFMNRVITVTGNAALTIATSNNPFTGSGNVSLTVSASNTGANGIDTGSLLASTWYYVYLCYGNSGTCGLISSSSSTPTLPSGYSNYVRMGAVLTNSSGYLYRTIQQGNYAQFVLDGTLLTAYPTISSGTTSSTMSFSTYAPSTAARVNLYIDNESGGGISIYSYGVGGRINYVNPASFEIGYPVWMQTGVTYTYQGSVSSDHVLIIGWEDNL